MKIGYYCPLVGDGFLKRINITPVDLKAVDFGPEDQDFSGNGSNKCDLICKISGLAQKNADLDGIILTNCCHEQEQLVDFLNSDSPIRIFKLNIPRVRSSASVHYLSEQLDGLIKQLACNPNEFPVPDQKTLISEQPGQSEAKSFPVILVGINIPSWLSGLLEENGLQAIKQISCGYIEDEIEEGDDVSMDSVSCYAKKITDSSFCLRNTSSDFTVLNPDYRKKTLKAVLFIALEYCTTATYGFVRIKDYFTSINIPVFKVLLSDWNKPTSKVITQIESLSHLIRKEFERKNND